MRVISKETGGVIWRRIIPTRSFGKMFYHLGMKNIRFDYDFVRPHDVVVWQRDLKKLMVTVDHNIMMVKSRKKHRPRIINLVKVRKKRDKKRRIYSRQAQLRQVVGECKVHQG